MPSPLGDTWDDQRRWSTDGTLTKVFVVWIHRDRDILKLHIAAVEGMFPLRFIGALPRGSVGHVDESDERAPCAECASAACE